VEITTDDQLVAVSLPRSEFLELGVELGDLVTVHEVSAQRLSV